MVTDVGAGPDGRATGPSYAGRARSALLPTETATALAMVLTELLQNAVEHGYPRRAGRARSWSRPERLAGRLRVHRRRRRRRACRTASTPTTRPNLGLSIVRTLVESELGGLLELRAGPGRRARAPWSTYRWTAREPA